MVKEENKFGYGIKGKLTSAVAMLLVAVIMVVSSTYAWFTLSTAPEVTGITTAVGANGALEMLLLTKNENGEWVYNNGNVTSDPNTYWGNLVDLTDKDGKYGVNKIALYPSKLNVTGNQLGSAPLATPTYGSDGRVSGIENNTVYGVYNSALDAFVQTDKDYGFRAVGVASGMTPRQLAYREALAQVTVLMTNARNTASDSLYANGSTLANLAVKKGMLSEPNYTNVELKVIESMITDLNKSLAYIEDAYMQFFYAMAASNFAGNTDDTLYESAKTLIDNCTTPRQVINALQGAGFTVPEKIVEGITAYETAVKNVSDADEAFTIDTSVAKEDYKWIDFSGALTKLVDLDAIEVNGIPADEVSGRKDEIMQAALNGGILVTMKTGGGVYADIADQAKDFKVDISINGASLGMSSLNASAKMNTATTVDPVYLQTAYDYVAGRQPTTENKDMPLTEFYGYVIDLAFRTNAAQSNLLLQQQGIDRIYGNDNNNDATMGAGSTMTFASNDNNFSNEQVKMLMSNIRIVFFDTTGLTILAYAKLDMTEDNLTVDTDGITAYMYLYKTVDAFVTDDDAILFAKTETVGENTVTKYYSDYACTTEVLDVDEDTLTPTTTEVKLLDKDAKITALTQNAKTHVSALVYLNGETIENSHVAASVAKSMTGSMNLQFASDATLVPMEYGNLHQTGAVIEEVNVTAKADEAVVYTPRSIANATWSIDELPTDWAFDTTTGKLTIPANATADEVVIKATVNEKVVREITVKVAAPSTGG